MLKKDKLAILVAAMKPRGDDMGSEKEDKEGEDDYDIDERLDHVADALVKGVKAADTEAVKAALMEFRDCLREEDEAQDAEEG